MCTTSKHGIVEGSCPSIDLESRGDLRRDEGDVQQLEQEESSNEDKGMANLTGYSDDDDLDIVEIPFDGGNEALAVFSLGAAEHVAETEKEDSPANDETRNVAESCQDNSTAFVDVPLEGETEAPAVCSLEVAETSVDSKQGECAENYANDRANIYEHEFLSDPSGIVEDDGVELKYRDSDAGEKEMENLTEDCDDNSEGPFGVEFDREDDASIVCPLNIESSVLEPKQEVPSSDDEEIQNIIERRFDDSADISELSLDSGTTTSIHASSNDEEKVVEPKHEGYLVDEKELVAGTAVDDSMVLSDVAVDNETTASPVQSLTVEEKVVEPKHDGYLVDEKEPMAGSPVNDSLVLSDVTLDKETTASSVQEKVVEPKHEGSFVDEKEPVAGSPVGDIMVLSGATLDKEAKDLPDQSLTVTENVVDPNHNGYHVDEKELVAGSPADESMVLSDATLDSETEAPPVQSLTVKDKDVEPNHEGYFVDEKEFIAGSPVDDSMDLSDVTLDKETKALPDQSLIVAENVVEPNHDGYLVDEKELIAGSPADESMFLSDVTLDSETEAPPVQSLTVTDNVLELEEEETSVVEKEIVKLAERCDVDMFISDVPLVKVKKAPKNVEDESSTDCSSVCSLFDEDEYFQSITEPYYGYASNAPKKPTRKVRFHRVEVREYAVTIGPSFGAELCPLTLDWSFRQRTPKDLRMRETTDVSSRNVPRALPRRLTLDERRHRVRKVNRLSPKQLVIMEKQMRQILPSWKALSKAPPTGKTVKPKQEAGILFEI